MTGARAENPYRLAEYARLAARGHPVITLDSIKMMVAVRTTPAGQGRDAAGAYPLASPAGPFRVSDLRAELKERGLVTLTWVQDPFEALPTEADAFDLNRFYKTHHVFDRDRGGPSFPGIHQRNNKRALKLCDVREIDLRDHLDAWCSMYGTLVERHALGEAHTFDPVYFQGLAALDGVRTLGAFRGGELVSAHIWVCAGDRVYSHLAASSASGYQAGAAFAVNATALDHFTAYRFVSFGGVADGAAGDGLKRFKAGFSNMTLPVHLCGVIGDSAAYEALKQASGTGDEASSYFPAYRAKSASSAL